jgi:hypothetical protein
MPLTILLILVIGGLAVIALLLHLSGSSRLRVMMAEDARSEWHRHHPFDGIIDVTVAENGHAAIVRTTEGTGLLWSFGADTVAHYLQDFNLIETDSGFDIYFNDYATPYVRLQLSELERRHWHNLMIP